MADIEKEVRRLSYLAKELDKRTEGSYKPGKNAIRSAVVDIKRELQERLGVTLASDDDDCPESDPDCIPSEPPPKIP